jgi:hypothetical protein
MPNTAAGRWESLPLEMSRRGVDHFRALTLSAPRGPAVYVHVETPTKRVLRVGQTGDSIHGRWATSPKGHLSTFEWALDGTGSYRPHAPNFPEYVLFFYRLAGMQTWVWTLTCDRSRVTSKEDEIICEYGPIWEDFLRLCVARGVKRGKPGGQAVSRRDFSDPALPTLDGLKSKKLWRL